MQHGAKVYDLGQCITLLRGVLTRYQGDWKPQTNSMLAQLRNTETVPKNFDELRIFIEEKSSQFVHTAQWILGRPGNSQLKSDLEALLPQIPTNEEYQIHELSHTAERLERLEEDLSRAPLGAKAALPPAEPEPHTEPHTEPQPETWPTLPIPFQLARQMATPNLSRAVIISRGIHPSVHYFTLPIRGLRALVPPPQAAEALSIDSGSDSSQDEDETVEKLSGVFDMYGLD
jgi:hypothetical protein